MIDKITAFLPTDNPLMMAAIGIIAILLVISLIKSLFKLAFIVVVIGAIAVFAFGMTPDEVLNKGKELAAYSTEFVNEKVKPAVLDGVKKSIVAQKEDGTTSLESDDLVIEKDKNNKTIITVKSLNAEFTLDELSKYLSPEEMKDLTASIDKMK